MEGSPLRYPSDVSRQSISRMQISDIEVGVYYGDEETQNQRNYGDEIRGINDGENKMNNDYLAIFPELSPIPLFDFPDLLANSQSSIQLTPTTGSFPDWNCEDSLLFSSLNLGDGSSGNDLEFCFGLDSYRETNSSLNFSFLNHQVPSPFEIAQSNTRDFHQALNPVEPDLEFPQELSEVLPLENCAMDSVSIFFNADENRSFDASDEQGTLQINPLTADGVAMNHNSENNKSSIYPVRSPEDGYNWRKYGQKQVKGSVFPRSYYKCTYADCPMKKKVEQSHDGHVTKIIYNGVHNHQNPHPSSQTPLSFIKPEAGEGIRADAQIQCNNAQQGSKVVEGLESEFSTFRRTGPSDSSLSSLKRKSMDTFYPVETPKHLSERDYDNDDENKEASYNMLIDGCAEEEVYETKRRKIEIGLIESSVLETKVVLEVESKTDIMEDGYRWRKYGQKVVKGNPNPRSYYKCTNAGCPVRKHVERAKHNYNYVMIAYEDKHNHVVPYSKNNSHNGLRSGNKLTNTAKKSETQFQETRNCFDRKSNIKTEFYPRAPYYFPASLVSSMNFSPFSNSLWCNSFGLNSNMIPATHHVNDIKFLKPKPKQKEDIPMNFCFATSSYTNASSFPPVYHHGNQKF